MRGEDAPEALANRPAPEYALTPAVAGRPVSHGRIALVSTAALMHRGAEPFGPGAADDRILDTGLRRINGMSGYGQRHFCGSSAVL